MIAKLKSLLSKCHFQGDVVRTLANASSDYCLQRAQEEIDEAKRETDPEEKDRRLILATRLLTLARYKMENPDATNITNTRKKRGS